MSFCAEGFSGKISSLCAVREQQIQQLFQEVIQETGWVPHDAKLIRKISQGDDVGQCRRVVRIGDVQDTARGEACQEQRQVMPLSLSFL